MSMRWLTGSGTAAKAPAGVVDPLSLDKGNEAEGSKTFVKAPEGAANPTSTVGPASDQAIPIPPLAAEKTLAESPVDGAGPAAVSSPTEEPPAQPADAAAKSVVPVAPALPDRPKSFLRLLATPFTWTYNKLVSLFSWIWSWVPGKSVASKPV